MSSLIFDILERMIVFFPWSKRKSDCQKEWSGTVEAKRTRALSKNAYLMIFRTADGQKKKVRMDSKEDFDIYEEGRRYIKRAGQDLPDPKPVG
ncbi:MAG: hypothetical protein NTV04_07750 [Deltaproteobacteria bacterium]|nr:hypothetical protein [Deltaproteobacteria bacterium]